MAGRKGSLQIVPPRKYVANPDDAPMHGKRWWLWRQARMAGRFAARSCAHEAVRPPDWSVVEKKEGDVRERCGDSTEIDQTTKPLSVQDVDLCIEQNKEDHHTAEYDHCCQEQNGPYCLVLRRGQQFDVQVKFQRPYDEKRDVITVRLELGKSPKPSKSTQHDLAPAKGILPRKWSAGIKHVEGQVMTLSLQTAPTAFIGKWQLSILTVLKPGDQAGRQGEDQEEELMKAKVEAEHYFMKNPIYLIFNPWCKEDQVYMPDELERKEYVQNATGKIYTGNHRQISARPWTFGQYEDFMLECSLFLLEKSGTAVSLWGNAVHICRAISRIVNSQDDEGVLEGRWSGRYSDGTRPTKWVSSTDILGQFWRTKTPVKYGQCWVFSGVCTAVCRCLGIPCRSVTNFSSAHDCDGSVTIDYHYKRVGKKLEPLEDWNEDSVWNFHVWNECWMTRPDIGPHYAGWQAFDATPQETSEGYFQAGPCPVTAIKRGDLTVPYDASFIFAEVNADKVHWIIDHDNCWTKRVFARNSVGRKISTKTPGKEARLDLTNDYKFGEGTEEERAAVYRANMNSTHGVYECQAEEDVTFTLEDKDFIMVGSNFDITLKMQNKSRFTRTVHGHLTLTASYYTGVAAGKVKDQEFDLVLDPIKSGEAVMRVTCEDYLHLVVEQTSFRVAVMCMVDETKQVFTDDDTFRLRRPDIPIKVPIQMYQQKEFDAILTFSNPLPVSLTECEWVIEGAALENKLEIKQQDIESYDKVQLKVTLKSKRSGKTDIMASFSSKELSDVTGCSAVDFRRE